MLSRFSASIENEPAFTCPTKPKSMLAASTMLWIVILFYYDFPRDARFSFIKRHKTLFFSVHSPQLLITTYCSCSLIAPAAHTLVHSLTQRPQGFLLSKMYHWSITPFSSSYLQFQSTHKKRYECIPSPTHNWVKCVPVSRLISIGLKINSDKVSKFLFNQLTNAKPTTVQRLTRWWWIRHFWSTQPKNNTNEISIEAGPGHCFRDQSTKL